MLMNSMREPFHNVYLIIILYTLGILQFYLSIILQYSWRKKYGFYDAIY